MLAKESEIVDPEDSVVSKTVSWTTQHPETSVKNASEGFDILKSFRL